MYSGVYSNYECCMITSIPPVYLNTFETRAVALREIVRVQYQVHFEKMN